MARPKRSPAEVSAARRAAAMQRHHPKAKLDTPPGATAATPAPSVMPSAEQLAKLPQGSAYDGLVGQNFGSLVFSYQDAVQREAAIAAELKNDQLREAIQVKRGNLFTREQIEKRDEAMDSIVLAQLEQLVGFVGTLVPAEQGAAARAKAQEWVDGVRGRIATEIEAAAL